MHAVGSLVRARGREWVVLPDSSQDFLVLRPLGGGRDDVSGVFPELEDVTEASFPLPTPEDLGDAASAAMLRTAGARTVLALEYDEASARHAHTTYGSVRTVRANLAMLPVATASAPAGIGAPGVGKSNFALLSMIGALPSFKPEKSISIGGNAMSSSLPSTPT